MVEREDGGHTCYVRKSLLLGKLSHDAADAGHGSDGKDKKESYFRLQIHLDLPDYNDRNG